MPNIGHLLIRLDDDDAPEYWEEIQVSEAELLTMLRRVRLKTIQARREARENADDTMR